MPRPAPCPLWSRCGGCPAMEMTEEEQLRDKARRVEHFFRRPLEAVHASDRALGYRARISLNVDAQGLLGYHRPRSHVHEPVSACTIARPELNAVLGALPPLPGLQRVELRTDGSGAVLCAEKARGPALAALRQLEGLAGLRGLALDGHPLWGDVLLRPTAGGVQHELSPHTFCQVNLEINELLVEAVRREALARAPQALLDLYAGAGNLCLPLAAKGIAVTAVESSASAVDDLRRRVMREGWSVRVERSDAGSLRAGQHFGDVVILDPPWAGAPGLLAELCLARPRALLYVCCNPPNLPRDLRPALAAGYRIVRMELFDMFPQTAHVELLAVLERP